MNIRSLKRTVLFTIILLLLSLAVTPAMATVISLQNGQVNTIGGIAALNLTMDNAPSGFSGYTINLSMSDPSVATITSVSFPAWAIMKSNTTLPGTSCKIKAIDLTNQVTPGATSIPFGTVSVKGLKAGTSRIIVKVTKLEDDASSPIISAVQNGTFTVNVAVAPKAAFVSNRTSGPKPLAINFTDQSTGNPTAWNWSFGDGKFSASKNPVHSFSTKGNFTIALRVSNTQGSNVTQKVNLIKVT